VSNPCVVVDRYKANTVLRMFYNELSSGEQIIKTAILNDRIWVNGVVGSLWGTYNGETSIFGNEYTMTMSLSQNGLGYLTSSDEILYRLSFGLNSSTKDYYVQSDWIDYDSDEFLESQVTPDNKFRYNEILKSLNY